MQATRHDLPSLALQALAEGGLAGSLSAGVLAWRGRSDAGSAFAPINAPGHWLFGREAIRDDEPSARHTLTGAGIHLASSMLWSSLYAGLQAVRARRTPSTVWLDAAAVTALAALVDLRLVPERLTPGFEHRLSTRSLGLVYASFGLGLALGGLAALRRR